MNIGQMLAMLEASGQLPSTSVPQAQTSYQKPRLNWMDVAQGPPAESDVAPVYQFPEVVVEAPRYEEPLPPIYGGYAPETQDPVFAELYGAPPADYNPMAGATRPSAFMKGTPGPGAFTQPTSALPPLPIKGAMAQAKPLKSLEEESAAVIPYEPVAQDVPTGAQRPIGFAPGQDIAMLEEGQKQLTKEEQEAKKQAELEKQWRIGQNFSVNINGKNYIVRDYINQAGINKLDRNAPVTIYNEQTGAAFDIPKESPKYTQIINKYQESIAKATPAEAAQGYTLQVSVPTGEKQKPEWRPAKIVIDNYGRRNLVYNNAEMGEDIPIDPLKVTPESIRNMTGSTEDAMPQFVAAQKDRQEFLSPVIERLKETKGGYTGTDAIERIQGNLIPTYEIGKDATDIPEITWMYNATLPGGQQQQMTIKEAQDLGYLSPGIDEALTKSYTGLKNVVDEAATGVLKMQEGEGTTMAERNRKIKQDQIDFVQNEIDSGKLSGDELEQYKKKLEDLKKELLQVASQGPIVKLPGGGVAVEGGEAKRYYSQDPRTLQGKLNIIGAQRDNAPNTQFTMDDFAKFVIQNAKDKVPTYPLTTDPVYTAAVGDLITRVQDIQNKAVEMYGADAQDVLEMPATFRYLDSNGAQQTTRKPILEAANEYITASNAFRQALRTGDATKIEPARQSLIASARLMSAEVDLPGDIGTSMPGSSRFLRTIGNMLQAPQLEDRSIPGAMAVAPQMQEIKAAPMDIIRPTEDRRNPKPTTLAYPVVQTGDKDTSYSKYSSGFNMFEKISASPQAFYFQLGQRSGDLSAPFAVNDIARSMFQDDGKASQEDAKAASRAIDDMNKFISSSAGAPMRRSIAEALHGQLSRLGANLGMSFTSFADDLEKLRSGSFQGGKDAFVAKYIPDVIDRRTGGTSTGYTNWKSSTLGKKVTDAIAAGNRFYVQDNVPVLYKQMQIALDNAARLWMETARPDAQGNPITTIKVAGGTPVKWLLNPFDENDRTGYSVLSAPMATTKANAALVDPKDAGNDAAIVKAASDASSGETYDAMADPAAPYIWTGLKGILSIPAQSMGEIAKSRNLLDGISQRARANYQKATGGNLKDYNTQVRTDEDIRTRWESASAESSQNQFFDSVITYSLLPNTRVRKY
jgi:hypothetical protein